MSKTSRNGQRLSSAVPIWFALIFALLGVGFLAYVYSADFHPRLVNGEFHAFDKPDDKDLWVACPIVVVVFSGAGAALLAQGAKWRKSHRWVGSLEMTYPDEPWRWRTDWGARRVQPEQSAGRIYFLMWGLLCLFAAAPGLERLSIDGGWPDDLGDAMAVGAACFGTLAVLGCVRGFLKSILAPAAAFHLAAETGVCGGPLEGAIEFDAANENQEYLVRLVCERYWISEKRNSDGGKTRSLEVATEHDDSYRAFTESGLIPVRFAVPFSAPSTTLDWMTPVFLWYLELEDAVGKKLTRFWVPVFKTPKSSPHFELGTAAADRAIREETPEQVLMRYGVAVADDGDGVSISVPPRRTGSMSWVLALFAVPFLAVSAFMLPRLWNWKGGFGAVFEIVTGLIFGGVFGLIGLLIGIIAFQMLFERRRIWLRSDGLSVRRTYFGLGWTSTIAWQDVQRVQTISSGSVTGQRQGYRSVVAMTEGPPSKTGSPRTRRWSIISSLPDEAAVAARDLIESHATSPERGA